jgi:hypothetical protein
VSPRRSAVGLARPARTGLALAGLVLGLRLGAGCARSEKTDARSLAPDATLPSVQDAPRDGAATTEPSSMPPRSTPASPSGEAGAAAGDAGDEEVAFSGEPRSARSIGHTSLVYKVELPSGKRAAFKPAWRRGPLRYKGEIAARRLALALGLPNVPRAFFRSYPAARLAGAEGADELIVRDGRVKGALIPWIEGLEFLALERAPLAGQWKAWLKKGGSIPDDQRELARQLSTLVLFDFVTGNWDRWSGGNVGVDKATGTLLYIDNDGAFYERPPLDGLERSKKLLRGVDRLSRTFVASLRALDDVALGQALGEEAPGLPLLSAKALAGVAQRRKELLDLIDAKLADGGEAATFAFP